MHSLFASEAFLTQAIVLSCQRLPAVALEPIRQTLGVSYADVGLITSVFMIFYAGLSIVWGMLGDKIGTRWAMTIACGSPRRRAAVWLLRPVRAASCDWHLGYRGRRHGRLAHGHPAENRLSLVRPASSRLRHEPHHAGRELLGDYLGYHRSAHHRRDGLAVDLRDLRHRVRRDHGLRGGILPRRTRGEGPCALRRPCRHAGCSRAEARGSEVGQGWRRRGAQARAQDADFLALRHLLHRLPGWLHGSDPVLRGIHPVCRL